MGVNSGLMVFCRDFCEEISQSVQPALLSKVNLSPASWPDIQAKGSVVSQTFSSTFYCRFRTSRKGVQNIYPVLQLQQHTLNCFYCKHLRIFFGRGNIFFYSYIVYQVYSAKNVGSIDRESANRRILLVQGRKTFYRDSIAYILCYFCQKNNFSKLEKRQWENTDSVYPFRQGLAY